MSDPRPPEGWTRVPSNQVTTEMLLEWGFKVQTRTHIVGMLMVSKGLPFHVARHRAWAAGWTDLVTTPLWTAPPSNVDMDEVAEMVAWGLAQKGIVPASTKIRASRVHNIDTDRLVRRRDFMVDNLSTIHGDNGRTAFAMRMQELSRIEDELEARGVSFERRTLHFTDADRARFRGIQLEDA